MRPTSSIEQYASTLGAPRIANTFGGPGIAAQNVKIAKAIASSAAIAAERRRTGLDQQSARNEVAMQEQKQPPSVLARRRKQFLEGTILGSLMPEPSIELGAPMSMLGSSTLLGS